MWEISKGIKTKSMAIPTILAREIILISLGVIKEITSGDHKYHQYLEVRMDNKLNLNFTKTRIHLQGFHIKARWRNSWI